MDGIERVVLRVELVHMSFLSLCARERPVCHNRLNTSEDED